MTQLYPIVVNSNLYSSNLQVSNDATTPNTLIDVGAGSIGDSNNLINLTLASPVVINSANSGLLGLDTGSIAASTWYYVHIVGDSSGKNATSALISLSRTAPTLPFGYDSFRWIGQAHTDGSSHFLKFYATGKAYYWDSIISVLTAGSATTLTNVTLTSAVIPVDYTAVLFQASYLPATGGDYVSIAPGGSAATLLPRLSGSVAAVAQNAQLKVMSRLVSSAPTVQYINSAGSGSASLWVAGFDYSL